MTENGTPLHSVEQSDDRPRLLSFRDLPPQPLPEGRATVRDIHVATGPGLDLRWQLQLVELKGPRATLFTPAGTHQRVVGLSGPQVSVSEASGRGAPLGRDREMSLRSSAIAFQRPRLRVTGASMVLVLTFVATTPPPRLAFRTLEDPADLAAASLVLLLRGELRIADVEATRQSAVLLVPGAAYPVSASGARVLTVTEEPRTPE